jgi:hypothetical protein
MAKKKNSMRKIVQEVDKMFGDWDSGKKDPHSKLPEPPKPEKLLDFNYQPDEYPHNAVEQMRKVVEALVPYHQQTDWHASTKWDDSLQLYIVTAANFRIGIHELQFDYTGGFGYFSTVDKNVALVNQMMQRDEAFTIMQSSGANGTFVAEMCKIDHMSSETGSTTTYKFFSMRPLDFHAFNKYREPLFKNDHTHTIPAGTPVGIKEGGSLIVVDFIPHTRMIDRKWSPQFFTGVSDDLVETSHEMACKMCGGPVRQLFDDGNKMVMTCDTPGCQNNINFAPQLPDILPDIPVKTLVEAAKLVKNTSRFSASKLIMSVFSIVPAMLVLVYVISQVMK